MINASKTIALAITLSALIFPVVSFAQTTPAASPALKVDLATQRVNTLKAKADNEIDRRLLTLNLVLGQINANTKISPTSKTTLTTELQGEITNLTTLKTKIDADTDLPTLKTDVSSIVSSYRVYALVMPQVAIVQASERAMSTSDNLSAILAKLQAAVNTAKAAGQNTTAMQKTLDGVTTKLADAKTQATAAETAVLPLTPDGYPGNRTTLTASRAKVLLAHTDLKSAIKDIQSVFQSLKLITSATAPSVSTPSATTTTP